MIPSSAWAPSLRALLIGAVGCLVVGAGFQYSDMILKISGFGNWFFTPGPVIMFFVLVLFLNPLVGLIRRRWMLSPAELAQIYVMWIVGSGVTTDGFVSYFLPKVTSVIYYASPENNWRESLLPYIPEWIIPHREFAQIRNFYEGAPKGQGVPWRLWLPPLLHWLPFALSLFTSMICIMAILRKQWITSERLVFPMTQLPIAMIRDGDRPSLINPFFKDWLMWLGFAIPFIINFHNLLTRYYPFLPHINTGGEYIYLFRDLVGVRIGVSFMMLGFTYFIRREVSLGLCFFFLLNVLQEIAFALLGGGYHDPMLSHWMRGDPILSYQGLGAFTVLVLFGLWNARGHLLQVWRKAVGRGASIDDSGEILSYRAAVFTLLGCFTFMGLWLWQSGLPAWITPCFLFFAFVLFVGITRIIAEGGFPSLFAPIIASDVMVGSFGTRALGSSGIIALAFTYVWASDIIIFVMTSCANGLKVIEETVKKNRRLIFWSMLVAIVVTFCSSIWMMLDLAYVHGGLNTSHFFWGQSQWPFDNAATRIASPQGPRWEYWGYTAIGGVLMALFMLAQQRFVWWPFHPISFPISMAANKMFFSVLLAWAIKSMVLRFGGPRLFQRLRPFFLGLILGEFVPRGVVAMIELCGVLN